ncbi:glycosyltransferase [Guyparkeria hydrothermalis]|uniref:glycosyltransferase n=1 Tax=Guyparkeria hydrothermalis TaxID=923 RepID=UPI0020223084|nr:glycosyltransferase [Guyparkeria hydrothermalis]MCL7745156.1 glycosyltransferase [Guyparkeria hydrothermalis]
MDTHTSSDPLHLSDITMFWGPASGGVRRYLEAKRAHLAARPDCRHSLLVPGPFPAWSADGNQWLRQLPARRLPGGDGYRFPLRMRPWREALIELAPDVIEAGDPYVTAQAALAAGRRLDVPVAGFFHSDLSRLLALRLGDWVRPLSSRYLARLYDRFDWMFAPSEVMAEQLADMGVHHVSVQRLGVDTTVFRPSAANPALRQALGVPRDGRLLVFAGRNSREKHVDQLIETLDRLDERYYLLLIGAGMPSSGHPRLRVVDYVRDEHALAAYLSSSDALLHGGDAETFGLVIVEAMACGLPVVGVRAGATPELVGESVGELAGRARASELALAVQRLFERDWRDLGAAARRCAVHAHGWTPQFERQLAQFSRLAGRPSPAESPCAPVALPEPGFSPSAPHS